MPNAVREGQVSRVGYVRSYRSRPTARPTRAAYVRALRSRLSNRPLRARYVRAMKSRVLVGSGGAAAEPTVFFYDPATGQWEPVASLAVV